MSTFSQNRFQALLGGEPTETDKLGNTKPVEKKDEPSRSKRVDTRKLHNRVAVSPPSRRGRDRGATGGDTFESSAATNDEGAAPAGRRPPRGRQFDRHSGTGIVDNEKKVNQGWGRPETAQWDAAHDTLSPDDPAAEGQAGSGTATPAEPDYKTLEEYQANQQAQRDSRFKLPEARQANEGADDSQWKNAVPLNRNKDDDVYFSGKEVSAKTKNKSKKEKVYIDIEHPPHRPAGRGGDRGRGRGRGRGAGGRGGRGRSLNMDVNLSDASAFPTLGA
ncbi:hypothetical protein BJV82DRAFT_593720 [Fennellomyces sp. T-0311]|nr:hypothetical protein BJV82DRAFT_593720 [Fennellomyces sp. T-0311]